MKEDEEKKPLLLRKQFQYQSVMENDSSGLKIQRPVYQLEDLNRDTLYEKPYTTVKEKCRRRIRSVRPLNCLLKTIPVLKWLPQYSWRKHFFGDFVSGCTVAVMHIPQGMAYALLGGVPPIVGIYMAFFPVLIYFLFGTSRHVSMGTFAIVCLMTGKVVNTFSNVEILQNGTMVQSQSTLEDSNIPLYTNIDVASTVTFVVAIIQLLMYSMRLGILSQLLSETLVNGFTCACAFHVASSQLKDLFGLQTRKRRGYFGFIFTIYDSIFGLANANRYACILSLIMCALLVVNNELIKPWLAKKTRIPMPIELILVVLGTSLSYFLKLELNYGMTVVGHIPTGLPVPTLPAFSLIPDMLLDCFVITMVSYIITMSMALIFARKLMYEVDSNQELLALGLSNTVGSFFSCMPVTASLSRSMIQQTVGGVTQLASIVSCSILLFVLLWIGPVFEMLPRCVLASIILIALKSMLLQFKSIKRYWNLSKFDASVWIVTFFTTLFVQISIGLAAGVIVSLLSLFLQGYKPYTCLLGIVPNTDLYLDIKRYKAAQELNGIKIFHYGGGLSFASRATFKDVLIKKIGFDPQSLLKNRMKFLNNNCNNTNDNSSLSTTNDINDDDELLIKCIIIDFSALTFVDPSGVELLRQLQVDYDKLGVVMYIAGCSGPVYEMLIKCDKCEGIQSKFIIFPTIHDAVLFAQGNVLNKTKNT